MMVNQFPWYMKFYFQAFRFIAQKRIHNQDMDLRRIHTLAITVLSTGFLMWAYALISDFYIYDRLPARIGYVASTIHLLAPFLFLFTSNFLFVASIVLGASIAQQASFAYFTGGFSSNVLIWYGIVPVLAGLLAGRKGVGIWSFVVFSLAGFFMLLEFYEYEFPNLIHPEGLFISQVLMIFGWIIITTVIISVFILLQEKNESLLTEKTEKINNLLKILTHDVSNSLNVITTASTLFQKVDRDQTRAQFYFEKMDMASGCMSEVISNVRTLHSVENSWEALNVRSCSLSDSLSYCARMLEDKLTNKNLSLAVCQNHFEEARVMIDPLFFNHHVLMNILTNSIKFSEPGATIEVCAERRGSRVALMVKDHGVGMNKESLKTLFVEKVNKSSVGTAGERGSGFGMVICKSFMEKFGGGIIVDSVPKGEGAESGTSVTLLFRKG